MALRVRQEEGARMGVPRVLRAAVLLGAYYRQHTIDGETPGVDQACILEGFPRLGPGPARHGSAQHFGKELGRVALRSSLCVRGAVHK